MVADTFRKDHLGCYGNMEISTPNLDRFAKKSIQFNNSFAASFPTMPNRADLLTGRFTFSYLGWEPLPREEKTLAESLQMAGYTTVAVVDTPFFLREGYGYDRGFEDFEWISSQSIIAWPKQRSRVCWERRYEEDYFAPKTVAEAEKCLERYYKQKFFLYLDTWDPHEPWDPPSWYVEPYYPDYVGQTIEPCYGDWQKCGLKRDEVEIAHACYCGEVTMVDHWIGRLLNKVESMGLLDNTVIVFTSDHGFYFGEHGYLGKLTRDQNDNWCYSPLYQEITRIPFLIYVPDLEPRQTEAFIQPPDLMPTLLQLVGAESPQRVQGESFTSVLKGKRETFRDLAVTSLSLLCSPGEKTRAVHGLERRIKEPLPSTITTQEWTLLYSMENHLAELYNIRRDPGQSQNVLNENFEVAHALHRRFIEFLKKIDTEQRYLSPRRGIKQLVTSCHTKETSK